MNRKILIRIVIALAGLWFILLCLIYITREKYRDHAILALKSQLDEYILTEIQIKKDDIQVSLIKKFPYAIIGLNNILVKSLPGMEMKEFDITGSDTLLYAENVSLMLNLRSLLKKKYILKKITVKNASLNILTDTQGRVNYDILKKKDSKSSSDTMQIDLRDIEIQNMFLYFQDCKNDVKFIGEIEKAQLSGVFKETDFLVKTRIKSKNTVLHVGRNKIFQGEDVFLISNVQRNGQAYMFSDGTITLYGIRASAGGVYNKNTGKYTFNLISSSAPFQRFDNSIIRRYLGDLTFKPLAGELNVRVSIAGEHSQLPEVKIEYLLRNGSVKHSETNIKADKIYIQGNYTNKTNNKVISTLRLDSLYLKSDKTEIYSAGTIGNFQTPSFKGHIRGDLELNKLSIIKSLAGKMEMGGIVEFNIGIEGTLPKFRKIETKHLKKVKLQGFILMNNVSFKKPDSELPASVISGNILLKNLSDITLSNISIVKGKTDLQLNGTATNLPFFVSDKSHFPEYNCKVISNEFHIEDFIINTNKTGSESIQVVFPDSMIVNADIVLKKFAFGKFQATDVSGKLFYIPKKIDIQDFSMHSQGGTIQSNILLSQEAESITSICRANLSDVNISDLFYAFNEFGQSVITHKFVEGALTGTVQITASWDNQLNPKYKKLQANANLIIENGELINYPPMLGLSDFIAVEELRHIRFDKLYATVKVADEKVTLDKTQINSSAISIWGSGEHDFKNQYVYRFQVYLADVLWKKAKRRKPENTEFGYVVDDGYDRTMLPLMITGKDTVFRVSYDKTTATSLLRDRLSKEKQEWKELILPDASGRKDPQHLYKAEWEDNQGKEKKDTPDIEKKKNDQFRIEWDDE